MREFIGGTTDCRLNAQAAQVHASARRERGSASGAAPVPEEASEGIEGIRLEENGKGPFHDVSTHIAIIVVDKDGAKIRGYETHTDKDGDKAIWEISAVDDPQRPGWQNGVGEVIGATAKFCGGGRDDDLHREGR